MDTRERARYLAEQLVRLSKDEDPRVFLTALAVATDGFIHGIWPKSMHEFVLERHIGYLRSMAFEVPKPIASFR